MSGDRIDHAGEAREALRIAAREVSANYEVQTGEKKSDVLAAAQVHATLALVEQQRIANRIAIARDGSQVQLSRPELLFEPDSIGYSHRLLPEVREALGL